MDLEKLIFSLLPLILIVLFSWLFSFLGSKMKQKAQEEGVYSEGLHHWEEDDREGLRMVESFEGEEEFGPVIRSDEHAEPGQDIHTVAPPDGGPRVTPDPIEPKFWWS